MKKAYLEPTVEVIKFSIENIAVGELSGDMGVGDGDDLPE